MALDFSNTSIESWPIEKLVPYEKNHKKHPPEQIKSLAASIAEYGVENPIAVEEDGTIISGHGRRLALMELGRTHAPVRVFHGLTKAQANKLRIAVNKNVSNAYDTDILAAELRGLLDEGLDLEGIGLSEKETTTLLDDIGEMDFSTISDDIVEDVESHEAEIAEAAKKADEAPVKLDKAFGTKTITADQARIVTRFIGVSEANFPHISPMEAMVAQMQRVIDHAD